jgi:TatD DNase family protein
MTLSNNGKKIIDSIPNDRILLETDGPFVEYNKSPSTPLLTQVIAQNIKDIKKLELDCKLPQNSTI